jgi:hypothetical protein
MNLIACTSKQAELIRRLGGDPALVHSHAEASQVIRRLIEQRDADEHAKWRRKYERSLQDMPASGGGGLHPYLCKIAFFGVKAGFDRQAIFHDIRGRVQGARPVPDSEIMQAIQKKEADCAPRSLSSGRQWPAYTVKKAVGLVDGAAALRTILKAGEGASEAEIQDASPVRIDWEPKYDAAEVLECLYRPTDNLFIGNRTSPGEPGRNLRPAAEWIDIYRKGGTTAEHIIWNPLSGAQGLAKDGSSSYRADACVIGFRYAIIEFDRKPVHLLTPDERLALRVDSMDELSSEERARIAREWPPMPRDLQFAFFAGIHVPLVALVCTGGKSIHGVVRVDGVDDATGWTREIECGLYDEILTPMGVDSSCKNEARLSRLPGHYRVATQRWQRVLYLAPSGRRIRP